MRSTHHLTALILITLALLALGTGGAAAQALGFSWPEPLNTNATTDSGNDSWPHVTTDGLGNWVAVWMSVGGTDWDIFVSRSTDNGATWTPRATLSSGYGSDPQVTTDGLGNWVAVWWSDENVGGTGTDADIFVSRSTDSGATWSPPATLNTDAIGDSASDAAAQVTTDGLGNWVTVWHHEEAGGGV